MVVPEREDGVHALALAVIEGVGLDRVLTRGRNDLVDLIVQFLPGRRVGVNESRVDEQPLVAVLEVVEKVLCLLFRVLEL